MPDFIHRLPPPHAAAPLAQDTHSGPQSGVRVVAQEPSRPAAAGEPAVMALVGVGLVAVTMMRRWQQASARLDAITRRARAEVFRARALRQYGP